MEAKASGFGEELYVEKLMERPKHVEVQVAGDGQGGLVYLWERDCTLQRRHQKILEEAPCPGISPALAKALGEAAVKGAKALGYSSVGTFEFLLDSQGRFYFIEVNPRIQVEHPVTEAITGVDLVKLQIRLAAGERLPLSQREIPRQGHAIECRITAENPKRSFQPSSGTIELFCPPGGPGIRVDSHAFSGYSFPSHYDSLLAKIIAHGCDRSEAIGRLRRALTECVVQGLETTLSLHLKILDHPAFLSGAVHTRFIEEELTLDDHVPVAAAS